ncbi:MAG: winged helix-turn-helix transcriptional regulator [Candidatus Lokiarchaeota archaeon]|nr:winged helix-turn-helix transcriptional regulator [Candidatus Lokiarchaeota archaeon]MBD3340763.1 winged helix-turn-helix transcriptional regulator [Candidatus Lokiarchaeota archaeon]
MTFLSTDRFIYDFFIYLYIAIISLYGGIDIERLRFGEEQKKMMNDVLSMDEIDRQIVQLIQKRPDLTHTEIAEHVNRSQPTVGMRIKKMEQLGVLKFQAGINLRTAPLNFALCELDVRNPNKVLEIVNNCPFMVNSFNTDGDTNVLIMVAGFNLKQIDKIVNYHFRNHPDIKKVKMRVITGIMKDFVVPINLNFDKCVCLLKDECLSHSHLLEE